MKIVLTSTNLAKKTAAEKILNKYFNNFKLECIKVDSGVSNTPTTDEEGILGAKNRIKNAQKQISDADIYIGLEGVINQTKYATFVCGWCVIDNVVQKRQAIGGSAKVMIPDFIASDINFFGELSDLVKNKYNSSLAKEMDKIGTNGILTNKAYTRIDEFKDALKCALSYLENDTNYSNN